MSVPGSSSAADPAVTIINGHEVPLLPSDQISSTGAGSMGILSTGRQLSGMEFEPPLDASGTDWIIVKFDRPVDYIYKDELLQQQNLKVFEHLGDCSYLCKYTPTDLKPISDLESVSHLALYPEYAVPASDIEMPTMRTFSASTTTGTAQAPPQKEFFVIGLHPSPSQTPEQVLERLQESFGAKHIDENISGNSIRVEINPAAIPEISRIDSIRTIETLQQNVPYSVRQRAIMGFSGIGTNSKYKGKGEIVFVSDTGFDLGSTEDVHPAFTGRVLAATTIGESTHPADYGGHGTHVAGSILGNMNQYHGTDMFNATGTAPEARLISIARYFGSDISKAPKSYEIFTQYVPGYGKPTIMNASWGNAWQRSQNPYGVGNAEDVDRAMFEYPDLCLIFAAGNAGDKSLDRNGILNTIPQIGDYAAAKNCITVGLSYSDRPLDFHPTVPGPWPRYKSTGKPGSSSSIVFFSSTGPTAEGRLKPDVVAPGGSILSAKSRAMFPEEVQSTLKSFGYPGGDDLIFMSGTSMAAPAVTGCVAVLRGAFRERHQKTPTGALLKALIIHGAVDLMGPNSTVIRFDAGKQKSYPMTAAPNPFQGYGLVNINNSLLPILDSITDNRGFIDGIFYLSSGRDQKIRTITIPSSATKLIVTLAYTDPPGKELQNQISLTVKLSNGQTALPLQPTDPLKRASLVFKQPNVAKIVAPNPPSGPAEIFLNVISLKKEVKYAVVWSVLVNDSISPISE